IVEVVRVGGFVGTLELYLRAGSVRDGVALVAALSPPAPTEEADEQAPGTEGRVGQRPRERSARRGEHRLAVLRHVVVDDLLRRLAALQQRSHLVARRGGLLAVAIADRLASAATEADDLLEERLLG